MRPLFFDFTEEICYEIFDQYLFGPDIMVCPVYEKGRRERRVYLPSGHTWIDTAVGKEYQGGCWITVEAPWKESRYALSQSQTWQWSCSVK